MLWHAEAGAGRPGFRGEGQGGQCPGAGALGGAGLGYRRAGAFLRADVQAGTAADVSGGRAGAGSRAGPSSIPSITCYLRHKADKLRTDFAKPLGQVSYHVPCHLRVQNIGLKTRDVLALIPDTTVEAIERCSGHDGTYGVKTEFRAASVKIAMPVVEQLKAGGAGSLLQRLSDGRRTGRRACRPRGPSASDPAAAPGLRHLSPASGHEQADRRRSVSP